MASHSLRVPPGFDLFDPGGAPPDFLSPRVAAFFAYWQSLRGARPMPARADFDPSAVRNLLPHLMLVDIGGEPIRARYRLVGTVVAEIAKFDFTGEYADALDFQEIEEFDYGAAYRAVFARRQPGRGRSAMLVGNVKSRWIEFVICPFADDGATVTQCVALEDYEPLDLLDRDALAPVTKR